MRSLLLSCLMLVTIMAQATVYRWVDKDGKVHYSDEPRSNAEVVELKENTHNQIHLPLPASLELGDTQAAEKAVQYTLSIVSPVEEATIRDNNGNIEILANTSPELPQQHQLELYMDGARIAKPQHSGLFKLHNIDRGAHSFVIKAVTQDGKVLASSPPRTVFLHRTRLGNR